MKSLTDDQLKECREAFEKWALDRGYNLVKNHKEEYLRQSTALVWDGYQEAWSARLPNPQPVVSREAIPMTWKHNDWDGVESKWHREWSLFAGPFHVASLISHGFKSDRIDPLYFQINLNGLPGIRQFDDADNGWYGTGIEEQLMRLAEERVKEWFAALQLPAPQAPQIEGVLNQLFNDIHETSRMVQRGFDGRTGMYWNEWTEHLDKVRAEFIAEALVTLKETNHG